MKRLLIIFLLLPSLAWAENWTDCFENGSCKTESTLVYEPIQLARMNAYIAGAGGAAASCSTASDSEIFTPTTQPGTSSGASAYNAIKITLASSTTVTSYKVLLCDAGTDAGSVTTALYNDDGNGATSKPTTLVTNSGKNIASSSIDNCGSAVSVDFDLATPLVVGAGTYWIVNIEVDGAARNNPSAVSAGNRVCYSANGSTWTCADNNAYDMELWGCN